MTPKIRFCLPILVALGLVFSAGCKVSVSSGSSTADDAKANGGSGDAKPTGDGDGADDGDDGGGGGGGSEMGLSGQSATPGEGGDGDGGDGDGAGGGVSGPGDISAAPKSCEDAGKKAGDSWKEDCNTCNCTDQGQVVCTRMACETDSPKR